LGGEGEGSPLSRLSAVTPDFVVGFSEISDVRSVAGSSMMSDVCVVVGSSEMSDILPFLGFSEISDICSVADSDGGSISKAIFSTRLSIMRLKSEAVVSVAGASVVLMEEKSMMEEVVRLLGEARLVEINPSKKENSVGGCVMSWEDISAGLLDVASDGEVEPGLKEPAEVARTEGEFLMVDMMISNRSRVVRSVLVVVSFTSGIDVMTMVSEVVISVGD
jgi:hypothetical protein